MYFAKQQSFARGAQGHVLPPPPRKFLIMVQFGAFLDYILSLKFFKNYHFLYKIIKNSCRNTYSL